MLDAVINRAKGSAVLWIGGLYPGTQVTVGGPVKPGMTEVAKLFVRTANKSGFVKGWLPRSVRGEKVYVRVKLKYFKPWIEHIVVDDFGLLRAIPQERDFNQYEGAPEAGSIPDAICHWDGKTALDHAHREVQRLSRSHTKMLPAMVGAVLIWASGLLVVHLCDVSKSSITYVISAAFVGFGAWARPYFDDRKPAFWRRRTYKMVALEDSENES